MFALSPVVTAIKQNGEREGPVHGFAGFDAGVLVACNGVQRALCVLAMLLCLGSAFGLLSPCDDRCSDEIAGRACPPLCATCSCATHAAPASIPTTPVLPVPAPTIVSRFELTQTVAPAPDPKELLHVPRYSC